MWYHLIQAPLSTKIQSKWCFQLMKQTLPHELEDFCSRIYKQILRKHKVYVECVYLFNEENLKPFFFSMTVDQHDFDLEDVIQTQNING